MNDLKIENGDISICPVTKGVNFSCWTATLNYTLYTLWGHLWVEEASMKMFSLSSNVVQASIKRHFLVWKIYQKVNREEDGTTNQLIIVMLPILCLV